MAKFVGAAAGNRLRRLRFQVNALRISLITLSVTRHIAPSAEECRRQAPPRYAAFPIPAVTNFRRELLHGRRNEVVTDAGVTAPYSAPKATLFLLAGLVALSEFAVTAYIPAITIIADGLGVRTEVIQTTVSVGLVTGAIAGLVIGAVADSMGRRQLLFPALGALYCG